MTQEPQGEECDHAWQKIPPPAALCAKCWSIKMDGLVRVALAPKASGMEKEDGFRSDGSSVSDRVLPDDGADQPLTPSPQGNDDGALAALC